MRRLTPEDVRCLRGEHDPDSVDLAERARVIANFRRLVMRGCVERRLGDDGRIWFCLTHIGRLALVHSLPTEQV